MDTQAETPYSAVAARRRRTIYILCGAVVVACGVAMLLLSGSKPAPTEPSTTTARTTPGTPPSEEPAGTAPEEPIPAEPIVPSGDPRQQAREEADRLFTAAMEKVKTAMRATPGSDEHIPAFQDALKALIATQNAYEELLERFPDQEQRLDRRLADLQAQLYWCRKSMPATAFDDTGAPPGTTRREPSPTRRDPPRIEPRRPPTPVFRPEQAAARFGQAARRAFDQGRPDLVLETGEPLLADPRMAEHLEGIPAAVELAKLCSALLEAVRNDLLARTGESITLSLRKGPVTGRLEMDGEAFSLAGSGESNPFRVSDLAAGELLSRWEACGALGTPPGRRTAGAYLLLRQDGDAGVRQLLLARKAGEDVSTFHDRIEAVLGKNPELSAFSAWIDLEPLLLLKSPEICGAVEQFRLTHGQTACFSEHREDLFRAHAAVAKKMTFDLANLFEGADRVSGKTVNLEYDFEEGDDLLDFGVWGEWKVEGGALVGTKGSAWVERFDLKGVDLRIVLAGPTEITLGLWGRDRRGRGGVNLMLKPGPAGLRVSLARGDRAFAAETIPLPRGKVEVLLLKREERYQVRVNRRPVLKANDQRKTSGLVCVGLTCRGTPVVVEELSIKTDLDLDWANGGGSRFALWIQDWHLTPGGMIQNRKNIRLDLLSESWPEPDSFDPTETDEEGKPRWRHLLSDTAKLDLNRHFKPNDWRIGYLAVRIWSPQRRTAVLELAADDEARAWLNGELVIPTAPLDNALRIPVKLKAGDNLLLLKVVEATRDWWIRARLLDKNGHLMPDLIYW